MKYLLLPFLASILLFTACNNDKDKSATEILNDASNSKNINAGSHQFTVAVPDGWIEKDTVMQNIKFKFVNPPLERQATDLAGLNILSEGMGNLSYDGYLDKTKETMLHYDPDFKILQSGEMTIDGAKSKWFTYTLNLGKVTRDAIVYVTPHNGIAYVITGATKRGDLNQYRSIFDGIAQSFKLQN